MSEELSITASGSTMATWITVPDGGVTSTSVQIDYKTLNGNKPNAYGNQVAIFQSGPDLPWNVTPEQVQANPNDDQDGSFNFEDLQVQMKSYLVAYAVGNDAGTDDFPLANVCATAFIPAGSDTSGNTQDFTPSVSIKAFGSDSVTVNYSMPPGQTPQTAGHYLAIWEGKAYAYDKAPMKVQPITSDQDTRSQPWNGLKLLRSTSYTVAYIAGSAQHDMACAVTFTT